jgi:hypothetical protein
VPDEPRRAPEPNPAQAILLDMEVQLQDISLKLSNGDQARNIILQRLDKIVDATAQVPHLIYRMEQQEKRSDRMELEARENSEFRIRMETTVTSRRTSLAVVATICGGLGGAILAWLLGIIRPH